MVHSRASFRRDQAPSAHSVQATSGVTLSGRAKRNRISSISDAGNLRKKRKIENLETPSQYRFPLRSRPNKSSVELVSSDQKTETSKTGIHKQKHTTQNTNETHLQQPGPSQINDKRTLRSQDGGSRSKSELSLYFTNYEQMLSLETPKPAKTHITLIDDIPFDKDSSLTLSNRTLKTHDPDPFGAHKPLHNAHRVNLNCTNQGYSPRRLVKDTLPEDVFHKAHRKAERHEKQLRNIEKERAQHEKVQLDRLLEELRGPDWLKVMGISGVTESEKKVYEPKRVFFIKEVAALIEKFRHWKEEEKRRKMEREQAILAEEEEEEEEDNEENDQEVHDNDDDDEHSEDDTDELARPSRITSVPRLALRTHQHHHHTATTTDVDAAAARQLHQEAISASSARTNPNPNPRRTKPPLHPRSSNTPIPTKPKRDPTSKPHHRLPAPGPATNKPKLPIVLAFGQPIPDPPEQEREFQLPPTVLTRDMIRARARLRRRLRRGSPE